jgi:hypothetical protein
VACAIGAALNVDVEGTLFWDYPTVNDLAAYLAGVTEGPATDPVPHDPSALASLMSPPVSAVKDDAKTLVNR